MFITHPLTPTLSAAWLATGVVLFVNWFNWPLQGAKQTTVAIAAGFVLALVYTQLAEYLIHRFPMHRRMGRKGILPIVRRNHVRHHRFFYGARFRTGDVGRLRFAVGRWYGFPILVALHWFWMRLVFSPDLLSGFVVGTAFHYSMFELTHFATHAEDFWLERVVPARFQRSWRAVVEHHRSHHDVPTVAFNVTPPLLGDRLLIALRRHVWLDETDRWSREQRGWQFRVFPGLRKAFAALLLALAAWANAHQEPTGTSPDVQVKKTST